MELQINIRIATEDDLDAIAALWIEFMDFHKDRDAYFTRSSDGHAGFAEYVKGRMAADDSCVLVAECGGSVVGYCLAIISKKPPVFEVSQCGVIADLAVTQPFRRKGIGRKLYDGVCEWFKQKGIHTIEVRVAVANETSTNFWRKLGFATFIEMARKEL